VYERRADSQEEENKAIRPLNYSRSTFDDLRVSPSRVMCCLHVKVTKRIFDIL
jgi:hypothetical protein